MGDDGGRSVGLGWMGKWIMVVSSREFTIARRQFQSKNNEIWLAIIFIWSSFHIDRHETVVEYLRLNFTHSIFNFFVVLSDI